MISWKTAAVAALTWVAASETSAQQVTHVAKTNPIGLFASQYQLGYEHGLNDNFSVQLSAGFMGGSGEALDLDDPASLNMVSTQRTGFIAIPEVRWYPGASACEGFYLALAGRYRTSQTVDADDNVRLDRSAVGGALLLGFQRLSDGYAVDFFLGPQYKTVDSSGDLDVSGIFNNDDNVGVRLGLNLGFGW